MSHSPATIVVLHDVGDLSISWLRSAFTRRSDVTATFISGDDLLGGPYLSHEINRNGASFTIHTRDGQQLTPTSHDLLINRLVGPPRYLDLAVDCDDLSYAQAEVASLYISILNAFRCSTINAKTGSSWRTELDWALLAQQNGLPVFSEEVTDATALASEESPSPYLRRVLVFDDKVFGPPHPACLDELLPELTKASEIDLLEVTFLEAAIDEWKYLTISIYSFLPIGGDALVDAFCRRAKSGRRSANKG
ncbi:MAG TPA: hypothetical protein VHC22_18015 [Pirellulales bacterium]|nr:hypothetical protein [Pirellulales bacterium]